MPHLSPALKPPVMLYNVSGRKFATCFFELNKKEDVMRLISACNIHVTTPQI